MTDTTTSPDRATEHYGEMLAEAQAHNPPAPVILPLDADDIDGLEVCNSEVGDRYECFELGPFARSRYLRIRTSDAVALAARLIQLADDLSTAAFEARDAKARAEMVECPGCRTRIHRSDLSCGAVRCHRIAEQEAAL